MFTVMYPNYYYVVTYIQTRVLSIHLPRKFIHPSEHTVMYLKQLYLIIRLNSLNQHRNLLNQQPHLIYQRLNLIYQLSILIIQLAYFIIHSSNQLSNPIYLLSHLIIQHPVYQLLHSIIQCPSWIS